MYFDTLMKTIHLLWHLFYVATCLDKPKVRQFLVFVLSYFNRRLFEQNVI